MQLTVNERIILINILNMYEGNFATLKTVRKLRESLYLSEEEAAIWQPHFYDDGKFEWRTHDDEGKPIEQNANFDISKMSFDIIKDELKKLDKQNKIKECHFSLYEKFVGED